MATTDLVTGRPRPAAAQGPDTFSPDLGALQADYDRLLRRGVPGIDAHRLTFSVMHGNGNVILLVDESLSGLSARDINNTLARELCESFTGIKVDGIVFVRTTGRPIRMTYFDRDGTNATMCGNGLRCVTQYGVERGFLRRDADVILTDDGPKWVSAAGGRIRAALGPGREFQRVAADRYFVYSGLAHLVVLLDENQDLDAIDVPAEGAALRYDERLCRELNHPEGLHVDFMQRYADGVRIRTYEVGVEDETRACGTGAVASAYVAERVWGLPYPVRVVVQEGELQVEQTEHGLVLSGVTGHLFGNIPPLAPPVYQHAPSPGLELAIEGSGG